MQHPPWRRHFAALFSIALSIFSFIGAGLSAFARPTTRVIGLGIATVVAFSSALWAHCFAAVRRGLRLFAPRGMLLDFLRAYNQRISVILRGGLGGGSRRKPLIFAQWRMAGST